ncbi:Protein of unknown function [Gryllus bimaculatus]|nr:Protein of unknown function [Gryllus bimaculatus]
MLAPSSLCGCSAVRNGPFPHGRQLLLTPSRYVYNRSKNSAQAFDSTHFMGEKVLVLSEEEPLRVNQEESIRSKLLDEAAMRSDRDSDMNMPTVVAGKEYVGAVHTSVKIHTGDLLFVPEDGSESDLQVFSAQQQIEGGGGGHEGEAARHPPSARLPDPPTSPPSYLRPQHAYPDSRPTPFLPCLAPSLPSVGAVNASEESCESNNMMVYVDF